MADIKSSLISSHQEKLAEVDLSFEVRFIVGSHGEILNTNRNGQKLLNNKNNFFDLLVQAEREKASQYLTYLSNQEPTERIFFHSVDGNPKPFRYRGKKMPEGSLLVGIETQVDLKDEETIYVKQQEFNDKVFQALDVGILILNSQNKVVYKNNVLESFEKKLNKGLKQGNRLVKKICEMSDTIRKSKEDIKLYHIYDDQLYRVYGLYNNSDKSIVFLIDDRAASDDYDKLLRYKQQMESVSHLAAGFAHELRNPLSVIRGFIQLSGLTKNLDKYYKTILSEIERMNRIIEDFLSLSRRTPNKEEYEPHSFFESVIALVRSECLLRNIRLKYFFEKSNATILTNRSMIIQVILNLLRNTIEAFPEAQINKEFIMEGRTMDDGYMLKIIDNGPGMDSSVLRQIGKPFFTTKENGTGIGLPLCKKIIQDHGGQFEIESEIGKGTTITILFPYMESPES